MADPEFKQLQDAVSKTLVDLTRTTVQLAAQDLEFLRISNTKDAKQLERNAAKILQCSRKLLQKATEGTSIGVPSISNAESLDDGWSKVVEVVDYLLEKTDVALDEFTGIIKKQEIETDAPKKTENHRQPYARKSMIPKPQQFFNRPPQNHPAEAFKPFLRTKPHALIPLDESIAPPLDLGAGEQYDRDFYLCIRDVCPMKSVVDNTFRYKHPYGKEIELYGYPLSVREWRDPIRYTPFDETRATIVDSLEAVHEMLAELKLASEIAVDLEHHDKHSFVGLVSLMQISTRDKDWIIDTLKPWRDELDILNEVFADPSILKVLHGAKMDIVWLQRDLGLYIVGLFDTYHASVKLGYPGHSLAFLLDKFTGVTAQKQYQMADWRVRPLPSELLDYARSDTHYLLYIYDNMRNELVEQLKQRPAGDEDPITYVLERSKKECLQTYEYSRYNAAQGLGPDGWYHMLVRTPAIFSKQQFQVFRAVHQWRDMVARQEDESIHYVMMKQALFNIARSLPKHLKQLHALVQPMSDLMRDRAEELVAVIQKAIAEGENGPDMKTFLDEHPETIRYQNEKVTNTRSRGVGQVHSGYPAVGEILRRERDVEKDNGVSLESIRAQTSIFWGPTIETGQNFDQHHTSASVGPQLEIPLPPGISGIETADTEAPVDVAEVVAPVAAAEPPRSETIVLRKSKKRKGDVTDGVIESGGAQGSGLPEGDPAADTMLRDVIAIEDEDGVPSSKRAKQAARNAEKARREAEREAAKRAQMDETPFDYASAPSVLDAPPVKAQRGGINPYAKAMDTSKGARKGRRERGGKSFTFKP